MSSLHAKKIMHLTSCETTLFQPYITMFSKEKSVHAKKNPPTYAPAKRHSLIDVPANVFRGVYSYRLCPLSQGLVHLVV